MKQTFLIIILALSGQLAYTQLPESNIYMFTYKLVNGEMSLSNAKYLTGFNPTGYNNQPSFINDNQILISSNYFDAAQTDILKLDIARRKITRVTATAQGEYSPTLLPNRREFSVIREILGGDVNQILWRYPISQQNKGKEALANEMTVGYHSWINGSELATFLVGDPHTLFIHNMIDERRKKIVNNPGRSLISKDGMLYYVHKITDNTWQIKEYDPLTGKSEVINQTIKGSEDMEFLSDGSIVMAALNKIYMLDPDTSEDWKEVADLSEFGLENINRIKVRRNKILLVNAPQ